MDTIFLDPNAYLTRHLDEHVLATIDTRPAQVGHVHLQVGDVATARDFYVDALGFEATVQNYPGALFASAGGYHHHVAMNTWNSRGAGERSDPSTGLAEVQVRLDATRTAAIRERAGSARGDATNVTLNDPWGTPVALSVQGARP